jgi:hypothetical protein
MEKLDENAAAARWLDFDHFPMSLGSEQFVRAGS